MTFEPKEFPTPQFSYSKYSLIKTILDTIFFMCDTLLLGPKTFCSQILWHSTSFRLTRLFCPRLVYFLLKWIHQVIKWLLDYIILSIQLECKRNFYLVLECGPAQPYLSFNVVQCPHPICSTHQEGTCGVPPIQFKFFCGVSPPPWNSVHLPHLALSWILSNVENLASSSLQNEATDWLFLVSYLAPIWLSI